MLEEIGRIKIEVKNFSMDIVYLSDGSMIVPEKEVEKFLKALGSGKLTPDQVIEIRDKVAAHLNK